MIHKTHVLLKQYGERGIILTKRNLSLSMKIVLLLLSSAILAILCYAFFRNNVTDFYTFIETVEKYVKTAVECRAGFDKKAVTESKIRRTIIEPNFGDLRYNKRQIKEGGFFYVKDIDYTTSTFLRGRRHSCHCAYCAYYFGCFDKTFGKCGRGHGKKQSSFDETDSLEIRACMYGK